MIVFFSKKQKNQTHETRRGLFAFSQKHIMSAWIRGSLVIPFWTSFWKILQNFYFHVILANPKMLFNQQIATGQQVRKP